MTHECKEYIIINPKNHNASKEDMISLKDTKKIKEAIWNTYNYENAGEDSEIIAEELYHEIFDLEDIDDILTFLNQNKIKYWIIEKHN